MRKMTFHTVDGKNFASKIVMPPSCSFVQSPPAPPKFNIESSRLSLKVLPFPGNNFASENLPDCNIKFGGAGGNGADALLLILGTPWAAQNRCLWHLRSFFRPLSKMVSFFRYFFCRFVFQIIFRFVQIYVCAPVLWNRCLRMLCSGGIQGLSSGKSGVVVLEQMPKHESLSFSIREPLSP